MRAFPMAIVAAAVLSTGCIDITGLIEEGATEEEPPVNPLSKLDGTWKYNWREELGTLCTDAILELRETPGTRYFTGTLSGGTGPCPRGRISGVFSEPQILFGGHTGILANGRMEGTTSGYISSDWSGGREIRGKWSAVRMGTGTDTGQL